MFVRLTSCAGLPIYVRPTSLSATGMTSGGQTSVFLAGDSDACLIQETPIQVVALVNHTEQAGDDFSEEAGAVAVYISDKGRVLVEFLDDTLAESPALERLPFTSSPRAPTHIPSPLGYA